MKELPARSEAERLALLDKQLIEALRSGTREANAERARKIFEEAKRRGNTAADAEDDLLEEARGVERSLDRMDHDRVDALTCAIVMLAPEQGVRRFCKMLASKGVRSQYAAAAALGHAGQKASHCFAPLQNVLLTPNGEKVQDDHYRCGSVECEGPLGPGANSERCAAAKALASIATEKDRDRVLEVLLRARLLYEKPCFDEVLLRSIGAPSILARLRSGKLATELRATALLVLAGQPDGAGVFEQALRSSDLGVQLAGLAGLLKNGVAARRGLSALTQACRHPNDFFRSRLLEVLEKVGPGAVEPLRCVSRRSGPADRVRAGELLKKLGASAQLEAPGSGPTAVGSHEVGFVRESPRTLRVLQGGRQLGTASFGDDPIQGVLVNPSRPVALVVVDRTKRADLDLYLVGSHEGKISSRLFKRHLVKTYVATQMAAFGDRVDRRRYHKDCHKELPSLLREAWSPDGHYLALSDGLITIYELVGDTLEPVVTEIEGFGPCSGFAGCNLPEFERWLSPQRILYRRMGCCATTEFFTINVVSKTPSLLRGCEARDARCLSAVRSEARHQLY